MEIKVKAHTLGQSPAGIDELVRSLRSYSNVVSSIAKDPHIEGSSKEAISAALKRTNDDILTAAANADSFSKALRLIAASYEETEKGLLTLAHEKRNILESAAVAASAGSVWAAFTESKTYKDIRLWLAEHGLIKAKKQERVEGQPVTEYQEREMDRYIKQEIAALRKKDKRFTEKYWKKASLEERKEILEDYIKEVCRIMGLPETDIEWDYNPPQDGYINKGSFHPDDKSVHINEWILENGDAQGLSSYDQLSTVQHELRHYYQHEAVDNPDRYVVTQSTIDSWDQSFKDYRNTEGFMRDFGMSRDDAFKAYQNQAVEVDARSFE